MNQLLELFLINGFRPFSILFETNELEKKYNRSDLFALLMLHLHGEMTMSNLAEDLGAPLSTTTSLTKRLVHKGLIKRHNSIEDKRIMLVQLTSEGEQLALQVSELIENIIIRIQSALTSEELKQFMSLALKVGKALQCKDATIAPSQNNKPRIIKIDD